MKFPGYIKWAIVACVGMMITTNLHSQHWIEANPADAFDSRTSFVNPAMIARQPAHFSMGTKMLHVGFLEQDKFGLRIDYLNAMSPYLLERDFVIGLNVQRFGMAMYQQSHIQWQTALALNEALSIGLSYQMIAQSYQQEQFQLGDVNDPLFAGNLTTLAHSVGLGVVYQFNSMLRMAFAWSNITRPNLSLAGDDVRLPYRFDAGISYMRGRFAAGMAWQGNGADPLLAGTVDYTIHDRGMLRFSFNQAATRLEGRLTVSKRMLMYYSFDYPMNDLQGLSIGSHQVGVVFAFGDERPLIRHKSALPLEQQPLRIDLSTDQIDITRIRKVQHLEDKLNNRDWRRLAATMEPLVNEQAPRNDTTQYMIYIDGKLDSTEVMTNDYKRSLRTLKRGLRNRLKILARDTTLSTRLNYDVLKQPAAKKSPDQNGSIFQNSMRDDFKSDPYSVEFRIKGRRGKTKSWHLEIQDRTGTGIQWFDGIGRIPSRIVWEFSKATLEKLQAGIYYYQLSWTYNHKKIHSTSKQRFAVRVRNQRTRIEITTDPAILLETHQSSTATND